MWTTGLGGEVGGNTVQEMVALIKNIFIYKGGTLVSTPKHVPTKSTHINQNTRSTQRTQVTRELGTCLAHSRHILGTKPDTETKHKNI